MNRTLWQILIVLLVAGLSVNAYAAKKNGGGGGKSESEKQQARAEKEERRERKEERREQAAQKAPQSQKQQNASARPHTPKGQPQASSRPASSNSSYSYGSVGQTVRKGAQHTYSGQPLQNLTQQHSLQKSNPQYGYGQPVTQPVVRTDPPRNPSGNHSYSVPRQSAPNRDNLPKGNASGNHNYNQPGPSQGDRSKNHSYGPSRQHEPQPQRDLPKGSAIQPYGYNHSGRDYDRRDGDRDRDKLWPRREMFRPHRSNHHGHWNGGHYGDWCDRPNWWRYRPSYDRHTWYRPYTCRPTRYRVYWSFDFWNPPTYYYGLPAYQSYRYYDPVPDIRYEVLGAEIWAADGTFLGIVSYNDRFDSIANEDGPHGSRYSVYSIWNANSEYGAPYGPMSAWDPQTPTPPRLFKNGEFICYVTTNNDLHPRIGPRALGKRFLPGYDWSVY
jgi:hypothetical protein